MAVNPEELLTHAGFVAALAERLVQDEHAGADVAQQTFLAAIEHPPAEGKPLKAWLSKVARNLSIKLRLAETRRRKRERVCAVPERAPSTDEVIEREEIRRKVVDAVLGLDEPYRSTLLLRFYEDLPPRFVAESQKVPLETVKTRLRRGIEQLRSRLDDGHGGSREKWLIALLPIAGLSAAKASAGVPAVLAGGLAMSTNAKISIAAFCAIGITLTLCTTILLIDDVEPPRETVQPASVIAETEEEVQAPPDPVEEPVPEVVEKAEIVEVAPAGKPPTAERKQTMIRKYPFDNEVPFNMALVPGGKVKMGMTAERIIELAGGMKGILDALARSFPEHTVKVDSLYCDLYEVTEAQWFTYLQQSDQKPSNELRDIVWKDRRNQELRESTFPIRCVNHIDVRKFNRWCGRRLPTEAEWMRAARGDDDRIYAWGDDWKNGEYCSNIENTLSPVGSYDKGKSESGIHDLTGSIWEWTGTRFEAFKGYKPVEIGIGRKMVKADPAFNAKEYVVKGGHYLAGAVANQLPIREPSMSVNRLDSLGFRCVKDVQPGMTLFKYAIDDLAGSVVGDSEFNPRKMYGADVTHLSEGEPRVITGYDGLMICPILKANTTRARIIDESVEKPQPIGIIHITRPLAVPDLPPGSYTLAYRNADLERLNSPEEKAMKEAEKRMLAEEKAKAGKRSESSEEEERIRSKERAWDAERRKRDLEARKELERIGAVLPARASFFEVWDKNIIFFMNELDYIVGYVEADAISEDQGYPVTKVFHAPSGEQADVELGIYLAPGTVARFKFRIAIKNNPF